MPPTCIGIPFYVWDLSERFHEDVVEDFRSEYLAGRTPNPCLRCNEKIKFAAVLDRALALGYDAVATGHYARLSTAADGTVEMHRAEDAGKDQSYVLGVLTQEQLAHSLFPLGDTPKSEVRAEAAAPRAARGGEAGQPRHLLRRRRRHRGLAAGQARHVDGHVRRRVGGEVVGTHDGSFAYTVGQRRGLRLGRPARGRAAALRARHRAGLAAPSPSARARR